ncbi:NUDIX hydrolase [Rothia sp. ZJ1223]|uniref:NUDIX hydrolase n=1 Tax=Rothia sp. ZJ1223 TaxID=2811098 RepID=UPI00195B6B54|nr:NUDIX hydrolase [Rothia sp. ZJ1223]MBM7051979.1 NUDIX hydrolase [Rothia sp. ZJ1223]
MSKPALYTGALKTVPQKAAAMSTDTARIERTVASVERIFVLPRSQQDAARTWVAEGGEHGPCTLKAAGAVMFVRDGASGIETFMTYRVKSPMGRLAFPGGLAIASDIAHHQWIGPSETQWAEKTGGDNPQLARAAVTTAIREVFEETGLLLAGTNEVSTVESLNAHEMMSVRQAISQQEKDFIGYLESRNLKMRTDLLKPVGHWHSPDFFHKRYDLHYFAAAVPVGQSINLLEGKGIWGRWISVGEVLSNTTSTALGDEVGQDDTVGKTLPELVSPGVMCALEAMNNSSSAIAFLSKKRSVQVVKPETKMAADGTCYLSVKDAPAKPAR